METTGAEDPPLLLSHFAPIDVSVFNPVFTSVSCSGFRLLDCGNDF